MKSGDVIPESLDAETALRLLVQNPLLIRRPLMQVENRQSTGFDVAAVDAWIGLQPDEPSQDSIDVLKQTD